MLTLWNGFDRRLADDFRLFDQLLPRVESRSPHLPRVDVIEKDDIIEVTAEVPGYAADDVSITFDDGTLMLEGKKSEERKPEGKLLYSERRTSSFRRTFALNVDVDLDKSTASMKDGVLTLVLPKSPTAQPRKIPVTVTQ